MRKLVVGDIHGAYEALKQVLEKCKFNYDEDKLIVLGDTCDGWPFVHKCFDELLKIKHLVYILGNHDEWALDWYTDEFRQPYSRPEPLWVNQGGQATRQSYKFGEMDKKHVELLKNSSCYHIEDNNLFVHGGIMEGIPVESTRTEVLLWDRDLIQKAAMVHPVNKDYKFQTWDTIFVGHTTTQWFKGTTDPIIACNVIDLDTGAGWSGKLTIMDIDTKEFWQSDLVKDLYPDIKGRG